MKRNRPHRAAALVISLLLFAAVTAHAQSSGSTRPRRATRQTQRNESTQPTRTDGGLLDVEPANGSTAARRRNTQPAPETENTPLLNPAPATPVAATPGTNTAAASDTAHAFSLLQQKQYAAALKEARQIAETNPNDSEAWKIAGFAEMNLNQHEAATADLQKALDLQRAARQEDPFTSDALAHAYFLSDKFDQALPLLVTATTRPNAKPEAVTVYYRGVAEYRTGKTAEAERTFNAIVKENPKDAASLYYLGQIAFDRKDLDAAIASLNRATLADARSVSAWNLLTLAYLQRAATTAAASPEKANADYLSAVRAGEGLTRVRTDAGANILLGQALIGAQQFPRAATVLERATVGADANPTALYLLGVAQSRAKNFPKAITALERAAAKTPDDVNIYRELGYALEISKQYARALAAYEKGSSLAPDDADFKESAERVRPYAK
ncbi:MAG TPA: tetratricopeptide repeat protein [Pyrinomonadaceae bacterium]|jgi:tetratricopeptide (TPR) repeat protein